MIIVYVIRWNSDDGGLHELPTVMDDEGYSKFSTDCWFDTEDDAIEEVRKWNEAGGHVDGPVLILKQVLL